MQHHLYINGYIGEAFGLYGEGNNFTVARLNQHLHALPEGTTQVVVHINSGGGSVTEGFAIYDILKSLNVQVITQVEGMCGSIATVIAQAGSVRRMFQNSEYFIHNPLWIPPAPEGKTAADLEKLTAELRKAEGRILDFYVRHTGQPRKVIAGKMQTETTLTAREALQLGFIDEIIPTDIQALVRYRLVAAVTTYKNQNQNEVNMASLKTEFDQRFSRIENLFKKMFHNRIANGEVSTTDGDTTIYYDGDELAEGTVVYSDPEMITPLPNGEYTLEDGTVLTVTDGEVTELNTEAVEEEPAKDKDALVAALRASKAELKQQLAQTGAELNRVMENMRLASEELKAFKKQVLTGGKEIFEVEGTYPKGRAAATGKSVFDAAAEKLNNKIKQAK